MAICWETVVLWAFFFALFDLIACVPFPFGVCGCCFYTLDAVFPADLFSDYYEESFKFTAKSKMRSYPCDIIAVSRVMFWKN